MAPLNISIEIAADGSITNTERGAILERFAKEYLTSQNFDSIEQVRITGMEVDLLATDKSTGEKVFVECKAHRKPIASEDLSKLLGGVEMQEVASGWMISTSELTKDGRGWKLKWEAKEPEKRRKLKIDLPKTLVERLVNANIIISPEKLTTSQDGTHENPAILLLSPKGEFWAKILVDPDTGVRIAATVFNARTGERVTSPELLLYISTTDSSIAELELVSETEFDPNTEQALIAIDLQNIVPVPMADNWADYRPARPQDFVGREALQKDLFELLDNVRLRKTQTRLFSIKAPSGWGKSSLILKISGSARDTRRRKSIFIFATDSRAATSERFVELALYKLFQTAREDGFLAAGSEISLGPPDAPFSTSGMREICARLKENGQVLCLVFDQFEELLFRPELGGVFEKMKQLCSAIDESQESIVFGFSWKTDGTIPPEHPAYHLWHRLSDRRFECDLRLFTSNEVSTALNRFAKELSQPLSPQLRRLLTDQCQGYPWLLKKLCIHILDMENSGADQSEMMIRSLNVERLFEQDLNGLSSQELACLHQISRESPAELFGIVERFSEATVGNLIHRRLVVRSGSRLNIYWDIFREFLRSGQTPTIPVTYIPQANFSAYMRALQALRRSPSVSYEDLAAQVNVAEGTADNIVRDLVMLGHAEANRKQSQLVALFDDDEGITETLVDFWSSHLIFSEIRSHFANRSFISKNDIAELVPDAFLGAPISQNLATVYAGKIIRWLLGIGLLEKSGSNFVLSSRAAGIELLDESRIYTTRGSSHFLGDAPPEKVVHALELLRLDPHKMEEVLADGHRNAVQALKSLGLMGSSGDLVSEANNVGRRADDVVRSAALQTASIQFVHNQLALVSAASGRQIGHKLNEHFGLNWSPASMQRTGSSLMRWAIWTYSPKRSQLPEQGVLF